MVFHLEWILNYISVEIIHMFIKVRLYLGSDENKRLFGENRTTAL